MGMTGRPLSPLRQPTEEEDLEIEEAVLIEDEADFDDLEHWLLEDEDY